MTERLSNKNPCSSCKVDRQIGNPNRWQCECDRCDKPNDWKNECVKKLAEYETAEEEGRLVVFPCKVGDILFCFSRVKIYPFKVRCIRIYEERVEIELWYAGDEENLKFWHITIMEQDVRSKFFLTREEAEKALKEMEGNQSE